MREPSCLLCITPAAWTHVQNPPSMVADFLTSENGSHGISMRDVCTKPSHFKFVHCRLGSTNFKIQVPVLQYLCYLEQIGISMGQQSHSALFLNNNKRVKPAGVIDDPLCNDSFCLLTDHPRKDSWPEASIFPSRRML